MSIYKDKKITSSLWQETWRNIQRRIFSCGEEYRSFFRAESLRDKKIIWLTGSASPSLVPIFQKQIEGRPALIPTGKLLSNNIAPLTGMLDIGLAGINQEHLSGVKLTSSQTAIQYAEQSKTVLHYAKDKEVDSINRFLRRIAQLENGKLSFFAKLVFIKAKIAAIRLAWFGVEEDTKYQLIKSLDDCYNEAQPRNISELIQEIRELLLNTHEFIFTPEEESLIHHPASIVWASVSKKNADLLYVDSDVTGEKALFGPQELGKDIQILFVEQNHYDKVCSYVRRYLLPSELHIMSMEVLPFIHTHTLKHNSYESFVDDYI